MNQRREKGLPSKKGKIILIFNLKATYKMIKLNYKKNGSRLFHISSPLCPH